MNGTTPLVSFCMSTYKRPELLQQQLATILLQEYTNFEIIVSDNDPEKSAESVVKKINDSRVLYFHNNVNLGMIKSFNKSIERSKGEFIVMVTDDDPIQPDFLATFYKIIEQNPGYSIYAGFTRLDKSKSEIEIISRDDFSIEILDPDRTSNILWSSCIVKKSDASVIGLIPDYGSPHLADHAFIALVGSENGGVIMNRMFSTLANHGTNFSKFNFDYYINGCSGFYQTIIDPFKTRSYFEDHKKIVRKHLGVWFISSMFTLKKYYTVKQKDDEKVNEIGSCAKEILQLPFMRKFRLKYYLKNNIFFIKKMLGRLKYS